MTRNLATLLREVANERPGLTLAVDAEQMPVSDAYDAARVVASRMLGAGLQPGDRVALMGPNGLDFLVAWMAAQLAGIEVALVNPTYPGTLLDEMLLPLRPKALLAVGGQALPDLATPIMDASSAVRGELHSRDRTLVSEGGSPRGEERAQQSIAGFMHTSGTTGLPKFCAQSHRYFLSLGAFVRDLFQLGVDDRVFSALPLFHVNPLGYGLLGALSARADFHSSAKFSVSGYWPRVVTDEITVLILHGAPIALLNRHADAKGALGHRVRASFFGDAEFQEKFGVPEAVTAYGSTEAGGITHTRRWRPGDECSEPEGRMRFAGDPRPGIQWTLDDGEILVRADQAGTLFSGYVSREGEILEPFDEQGWFHTGDIGRRTEDGALIFVERAAESVRVKGEFVPLEHLEAVLSKALHTPVTAWKRPSADGQDELVVFAEGHVELDRYREVEPSLPPFMRPAAIAEVEALPRDSGLGKVQRRLLDQHPVVRWLELPSRR